MTNDPINHAPNRTFVTIDVSFFFGRLCSSHYGIKGMWVSIKQLLYEKKNSTTKNDWSHSAAESRNFFLSFHVLFIVIRSLG